MNDADVSKQIHQMVAFIRQEAEEKANEISVSAEEVRKTLTLTLALALRFIARSIWDASRSLCSDDVWFDLASIASVDLCVVICYARIEELFSRVETREGVEFCFIECRALIKVTLDSVV